MNVSINCYDSFNVNDVQVANFNANMSQTGSSFTMGITNFDLFLENKDDVLTAYSNFINKSIEKLSNL